MSDLAEHLGLRQPNELAERIAAASLAVSQRLDTHPQHPKSRDAANPLAAARLRETVNLYVLQPAAEAT